MLSRWYSLFLGFLLLVLGIAGLAAPSVVGMATGTLVSISVIWLIVAIVALWFGFGVRNVRGVRWFAGIIGGLFFLWGIIQMVSAPSAATPVTVGLLASVSGLLVFLGSLGLSAALVPATWLQESEAYMPGRA